MQTGKSSLLAFLSSIGWPLAMGVGAGFVFYNVLLPGPLNTPWLVRYASGHIVSVLSTYMFMVGLAALGLKAWNVMFQIGSTGRLDLGPIPAGGQSCMAAGRLLDDLKALPRILRNTYLGGRLCDALEHVRREGSADQLDEHLKYLGDMDADRQHQGYSLVRIIIWATPMLGFLGTVIGITQALGELGSQQLSGGGLESAMQQLLAGLYVAFDTTALALTLSIGLMVVQFFVEGAESQLLAGVDVQAQRQLLGRFQRIGTKNDPHLASIQQMALSVVEATEALVQRQSEVWQTTINAAHQQWNQLSGSSTQQMQAALAGSLEQALTAYADRLADAEAAAEDRFAKRWEQWQLTLSNNARLLHSQQEEMIQQGEVMNKVLHATGDVISLQQALNENLNSLSGAKNFEDTVMSLAATIHLLNARLPADARKVDVKREAEERAA